VGFRLSDFWFIRIKMPAQRIWRSKVSAAFILIWIFGIDLIGNFLHAAVRR